MTSSTESGEAISAHDEFVSSAEDGLGQLNNVVEASFVELSRTVGEELSRLSADGQITIRSMIDNILEDLASAAIGGLVQSPIDAFLGKGLDRGAQAADDFADLLRRSSRNV